jgi:hypothetical protein
VFGRFEASRPNELWTGDALHGPQVGGRKTYLFFLWNAPPSQSTESVFGWNLSTSGWMNGTGRGVLRFHRTYR